MNRSIENEAKLVQMLSKDDIQAFNDLFNLYSGRLYRFAFGYLKSDVEAEDIVQEVFTIVWDKRKELRSELSFKSFLFTISSNLIKKQFRKKIYQHKYFIQILKDDSDSKTTEYVDYTFAREYLEKLVDRLPCRQREIFVKSRFKYLSIEDIAKDLGISHKTVENQLTTSLKYLRKCLVDDGILILTFCILLWQ